jgi:hypothetical protein
LYSWQANAQPPAFCPVEGAFAVAASMVLIPAVVAAMAMDGELSSSK